MADFARQELMQTILTVIILFGGYVYLLSALVQKASNKNAIPAIAVVLLIIYGGIAGFFVISFRNMGRMDLLLVGLLLLFAVVTLVMMVIYLIQNFRKMNKGMLALFIVYLLAVIYIVLLGRNGTNDTSIRMQPFALIMESIDRKSWDPINHMLLNIAMFVPLGVLFPLIQQDKLAEWKYVIPVGLLFSTLIESTQLILKMGQCDIDDVIANTLGAVIGLILFRIYELIQDRN